MTVVCHHLNLGVEKREAWKVPGIVLSPRSRPPWQVRTVIPIVQMRSWRLGWVSQGMAKAKPAVPKPSLSHLTPPLGPGHWRVWHYPVDGAEMTTSKRPRE